MAVVVVVVVVFKLDYLFHSFFTFWQPQWQQYCVCPVITTASATAAEAGNITIVARPSVLYSTERAETQTDLFTQWHRLH